MTAVPATLTSLEIGDLTVTFLPDGVYHAEAPAQFPDAPASLWDSHPEVIDIEGWLIMSIGAVLIRGAGSTVLVDTGIGAKRIDLTRLTEGAFLGELVGGELPDSLAAAGVSPSDVDTVAFTHLHVDHVGWVATAAGRHTFDRARYVVDDAEWAHWTRPEQIARGHGPSAGQLSLITERLWLVREATEIAPGVSTFPTPGHTPGHTSLLVSSRGSSALILGDALHCPVQMQHPDLSFVFDWNAELARSSRERVMNRLSRPGSWFVGTHFPNHVFGRLKNGPGADRILISS